MKKYRVELSEDQMKLVANCLEDISRFASGQWEMVNTLNQMTDIFPFDDELTKRRIEAKKMLRNAIQVLLPELPDGASKDYNATAFIGNTYQIYRTMLQTLSNENNIRDVYSSAVLPSGDMGSVKIELANTESSVKKEIGKRMKFKDAPIGARFRMIGEENNIRTQIFVKLEDYDDGLIVKWNGNVEGHQTYCCWLDEVNGCDFNTEIIVIN